MGEFGMNGELPEEVEAAAEAFNNQNNEAEKNPEKPGLLDTCRN